MPLSAIERPQRKTTPRNAFERVLHALRGWAVRPLRARPGKIRRLLPAIDAEGERLQSLGGGEFLQRIAEIRSALVRSENPARARIQAFAAIREAAHRTVGMRHYDCQMLSGIAIYHGALVELRAGEGKTLTATIPAAAAALAGIPVHVLTVNDYLAARDADLMRPVYEMLSLSVGCVVNGTPLEERRAAYACDIVYATNKEIVFDYMRDLLVVKEAMHPLLLHAERLKGRRGLENMLRLRGLHFAIVDEADSVLMDEARTPLVISGHAPGNSQEEQTYRQALDIARSLRDGKDYHLDKSARRLDLTTEGEWRILQMSEGLGAAWTGRLRRLELARSALSALTLFDRDTHYLVREDSVQIIDENTGRIMADRQWEQGLHQIIQIKEGVKITPPNETLSRLSFQRYFRFYHHLGGMTGTAREVARELWSTYDLPVTYVAPRKASRITRYRSDILRTIAEKEQRICARVAQLHAMGRPILIGTRTVGASERLSAALSAAGLAHRVLNARQDAGEADVIASAGEKGAITVATNMAGRGTDIKLGAGVEETGGLHVILTELHESGRLDRQLAGRCGRQGDPGSVEIIASLEDIILVNNSRRLRHVLALMPMGRARTGFALALMRFHQWRIGRLFASRRADLLRADEREADMLAFAGR